MTPWWGLVTVKAGLRKIVKKKFKNFLGNPLLFGKIQGSTIRRKIIKWQNKICIGMRARFLGIKLTTTWLSLWANRFSIIGDKKIIVCYLPPFGGTSFNNLWQFGRGHNVLPMVPLLFHTSHPHSEKNWGKKRKMQVSLFWKYPDSRRMQMHLAKAPCMVQKNGGKGFLSLVTCEKLESHSPQDGKH